MKRLTLLLVFGVFALKALSQLVAEYRFDASCVINCSTPTDCVGAGTPNASFVNASVLVSAGPCNLGPGLSGIGTGGCGSMNGFATGQTGNPNRARWADNWSTGGFMNNDYFGFTLTAQPLLIVFIDSIKWRELRSNTGPTNRQLRTSADTFTASAWTGTNSGTSWTTQVVTSGLPSFTSAAALDVRIYGYGAGGTAGSMRLDSLRVYAHTFSTLPVELLSFKGKATSQSVELLWTTASELRNDRFEIMRSSDTHSWQEIGRVSGAGTTTLPRVYEFVDADPLIGTNYYKLRQVDTDGGYEDSPIISVDVEKTDWFWLSGNQLHSDDPTVLFDELGRILSGSSYEHQTDRTGILILRTEDGSRSARLFVTP